MTENATATFAAGCFWGVEAAFRKVPGVHDAVSGYSGGSVKNPGYPAVCTGKTGHAEAVLVTFDPARVSYEKLVRLFFETHDPTTLDRQGPDVGTQYRSAIFYHDEDQRATAERVKGELDASGGLSARIVTEIVSAKEFYRAEEHHQRYFEKNGMGH